MAYVLSTYRFAGRLSNLPDWQLRFDCYSADQSRYDDPGRIGTIFI